MDFEKKENKRISDKPHLKFRYHKFSTFAGYIFFNDVTEKQKKLYKEIKDKGRKENFKGTVDESFLDSRNSNFIENTLKLILDKKMTVDGLKQACLVDGRKYSAVRKELNRRITDLGHNQNLKELLESQKTKELISKDKEAISSMVPSIHP